MCSENHGNNVPTPSSSPAVPAPPSGGGNPPAPPNAFDPAFLSLLEDRDEPPAAEEADWAGPWRLAETPDEGLVLYRLGESPGRGHRPFARFHHRSDALLALAVIASRREPAYRLLAVAGGRGFAVQSRAAWGEAVGWLEVFDEDFATGLSWAEALVRSPEALAIFLEACGKVVLQRAGAILEERVGTPAR